MEFKMGQVRGRA